MIIELKEIDDLPKHVFFRASSHEPQTDKPIYKHNTTYFVEATQDDVNRRSQWQEEQDD